MRCVVPPNKPKVTMREIIRSGRSKARRGLSGGGTRNVPPIAPSQSRRSTLVVATSPNPELLNAACHGVVNAQAVSFSSLGVGAASLRVGGIDRRGRPRPGGLLPLTVRVCQRQVPLDAQADGEELLTDWPGQGWCIATCCRPP